jgi:ribosomal protein S18 acetylase RimI-like enzyme
MKLATVADTSLIANIGRETYSYHFSNIWSNEGLKQYLSRHYNEQTLSEQITMPFVRYYIPYFDTDAVGILKIKYDQLIPTAPFDKGLELEKIYLLNQYTGKGFGRQLIDTCINIASKENISFIWLDVLKSNHRARKLYEQVGFRVTGETQFSTDIKKIDMWIMRFELEGKR